MSVWVLAAIATSVRAQKRVIIKTDKEEVTADYDRFDDSTYVSLRLSLSDDLEAWQTETYTGQLPNDKSIGDFCFTTKEREDHEYTLYLIFDGERMSFEERYHTSKYPTYHCYKDVISKLVQSNSVEGRIAGEEFRILRSQQDALREFVRLATGQTQAKNSPSRASGSSSAGAVEAAKRGRELVGAGKYEEGLLQLSEAIRLDPNNVKSYMDRGYAYYMLNKYDQTIEDLNEAIRLGPRIAFFYGLRGRAYALLGKYESAIEDSNEAIKLDPNYSLAYQTRGYASFHLGKFEPAVEGYSQVLKLKPTDAGAYIGRGQAYLYLGKYDQAIEDLNESIRLNPRDYAEPYFYRGLTYANLNQRERAIENYNEAIKINPRFAQAYCYRGITYNELGKYGQAIEDYNEAIRINPRYADDEGSCPKIHKK
jgi:tetratricopeptide (TPR) repeat protein